MFQLTTARRFIRSLPTAVKAPPLSAGKGTTSIEMAESGSASKTVQGGVRQYRPEEAAWRPWLVPFLVVACVVVFVVEMFVNNCPGSVHPLGSCVGHFLHRFSFQPLRENPLLGPSSYTLEKMGALQWYKIVHQHQAWRLVTCIWLHAGLVHLLANMLSLLFIGIRLEQQFGFVRIGVIYLLSGFGGAIVSALFLRNGVTVGASGPLFGILGAILSELIINWTMYSNKVVVLLTILFLIIINMAIGLLPYVDNFAHVGGFISGFLLGFVLLIQPHIGWSERHDLPPSARITYKYRAYQYCLWVVALLLLITGYAVSLVMLFRGVNGNKHCHWCHYLNCVETSKWSCGG